MSKFTVDSFIVELSFNENIIKGLQRVEKAALQSAQRIEKNLNKGFRINTKQLDSNLTASLGQLERKFNKALTRLNREQEILKLSSLPPDLMTLLILQNNRDSHELAATEQSQQLTQRI